LLALSIWANANVGSVVKIGSAFPINKRRLVDMTSRLYNMISLKKQPSYPFNTRKVNFAYLNIPTNPVWSSTLAHYPIR
jgi:hypothetical protein